MISDMIPNNDSNWIVKGNTIYYNYLVKIPILSLENDNYWVIIDRRYTKAFIKMMGFLLNKGVDFYFKSRFINNKEISNLDQIHNLNIRAYLLLLEDDNIYKMIKSNKFPFNKILINYLKKFNCMSIFIEELQDIKKDLLSFYYDYRSNKKLYTIPDEETRNIIQSLDRIIKIEYVID